VRGEPVGAGFRVERHVSLPSTNDAARGYALEGEPEGLLVTAAAQTAGKGRHGRAWASPAGNLHASLLLRPRVPLAEAATLSLVTALAVADALTRVLDEPDRLRVKWPNDVLLDGAKLAGILLEGADDGAGGCAWLVAGVGINLAHAPGPGEAPYAAAALGAATGVHLGPDEFLGLWLPEMRRRLDQWAAGGFAALRADWLERAHGLGRPASLRLGGGLVQGRFADRGGDGSVLIENELGCLARYGAGELFFP
jgi:BirA family biotin operon repressor/biotin-[acetyl-CoA-carboxylase] ligase